MIKLLLIVVPVILLLTCCWYLGSLRSLLLTLLCLLLAILCSTYAGYYYGVSFTQFIFLRHDSTLLTLSMIITLVLAITALVQLLHVLKK